MPYCLQHPGDEVLDGTVGSARDALVESLVNAQTAVGCRSLTAVCWRMKWLRIAEVCS